MPAERARAAADLEARLESIVERLGSASWAEREAATEELMALPMPEAQGVILMRLDRGGLDPEQRHRLVGAACRRLVEQPRGAMGISMDMFANPMGGVRVAGVIPGMPAAEILRVGDIIETINDHPITSSAVLSDLVQRLAPGTPIRIRIQRPVLDDHGRPRRDRNGQTVVRPIDVTMKLGSMEQLEAVEEQLGGAERAARGGRGLRRGADVSQERETEARWLRREFASDAVVVRMAPIVGEPPRTSFGEGLAVLERTLERIESGELADVGGAELLQQVRDGVDALRSRLGEPDVTDQDRQHFSRVLRRMALVLSRHATTAPQGDLRVP